jgi:hypothetical protein
MDHRPGRTRAIRLAAGDGRVRAARGSRPTSTRSCGFGDVARGGHGELPAPGVDSASRATACATCIGQGRCEREPYGRCGGRHSVLCRPQSYALHRTESHRGSSRRRAVRRRVHDAAPPDGTRARTPSASAELRRAPCFRIGGESGSPRTSATSKAFRRGRLGLLRTACCSHHARDASAVL